MSKANPCLFLPHKSLHSKHLSPRLNAKNTSSTVQIIPRWNYQIILIVLTMSASRLNKTRVKIICKLIILDLLEKKRVLTEFHRIEIETEKVFDKDTDVNLIQKCYSNGLLKGYWRWCACTCCLWHLQYELLNAIQLLMKFLLALVSKYLMLLLNLERYMTKLSLPLPFTWLCGMEKEWRYTGTPLLPGRLGMESMDN